MNWHTLDTESALKILQTDPTRGLSTAQAADRLAEKGPNELVEKGGRTPWQILWEQVTATMVLILIAAAVIAGFLGDTKNLIAILSIVVLYALLGFVQEYRAEKAIAALKKLSVPNVRVLRAGQLTELSARELVPGDILQLETGNVIPADVRLLEAVNLQVQEAALTGESEAVEKQTHPLPVEDLPLGDRRNLGYMGTIVTQGRGLALVVATGMQTELGKIADLIQQVPQEATPLQKRLDQLGRNLAGVGLVIAGLIFVLGLWRGDEIRHMLLTAVSVAVAIVPEGLPAVVTVTLALGAQRMLARKALIRKLPAVETLGSVTVICSDKTGTLTENKMTVVVLDVAGHSVDLTEEMERDGTLNLSRTADETPAIRFSASQSAPASAAIRFSASQSAPASAAIRFSASQSAPASAAIRFSASQSVPASAAIRLSASQSAPASAPIRFSASESAPESAPASALTLLSIGGALCNDAKLIEQNESRYHTLGDPTEGALVVAAAKLGQWKDTLDAAYPRVAEVPFDSERKRMTTVHQVNGQLENWGLGSAYVAFTKGSADGLLEVSSHVWANGNIESMDEGWRGRIASAGEKLAARGMRVLGLAFRAFDQIPASADIEQGLIFVGLFAMIDPPRAEVKDAVALTKTAGIRTVMITGDHPLTAVEIARQLGLSENGRVLTGAEIERMSFEELKAVVGSVNVFARVSPEHKIKIVQALQESGQIVSMTGDGVNDAPALRRANIGVAMGITGTDVSKEASDLVLLDDNFATIVAAVKEGRTIYDNIRKFVRFSVAGNIGKVLVMLIAPFMGKPIPLLPLQLLWLNLLTDGLLGLGLGVEKSEKDTMQRPPYSPEEGVFSRGAGWQTVWVGVLIGALGLGIGSGYYFAGRPEWQTMIFSSLAFAQVGQALASRSSRASLWTLGLGSNPLLLGMAALVTLLQLAVIYLPPVAAFFSVIPLSLPDLLVALGAGVLVLAALEFAKLWNRP